MILPNNAIVAVVDGEKLNLFRNIGTETELSLRDASTEGFEAAEKGAGGGRQSSSANPDESQMAEDGFAKGVVELLNQRVLSGRADNVLVIAAPRALGEMRKHYHKKLSEVLVGEIAKDLTGHSMADVEKAVNAA